MVKHPIYAHTISGSCQKLLVWYCRLELFACGLMFTTLCEFSLVMPGKASTYTILQSIWTGNHFLPQETVPSLKNIHINLHCLTLCLRKTCRLFPPVYFAVSLIYCDLKNFILLKSAFTADCIVDHHGTRKLFHWLWFNTHTLTDEGDTKKFARLTFLDLDWCLTVLIFSFYYFLQVSII